MTTHTEIQPPRGPSKIPGRIIVTATIVLGIIGGLIALNLGKRLAAERKGRFAPPPVTAPAK
jgi:hypothetical protein